MTLTILMKTQVWTSEWGVILFDLITPVIFDEKYRSRELNGMVNVQDLVYFVTDNGGALFHCSVHKHFTEGTFLERRMKANCLYTAVLRTESRLHCVHGHGRIPVTS